MSRPVSLERAVSPAVYVRAQMIPVVDNEDVVYSNVDQNQLASVAVMVEPIPLMDTDLTTASTSSTADDSDLFTKEKSNIGNENQQDLQTDRNTAGKAGDDLQSIEFSFLDNKNVCCGLCGEIVPYEQLTTDHLPNNHSDVFGPSPFDSDSYVNVSRKDQYETLKEKLSREKRSIESGFKLAAYRSAERARKNTVIRQRRFGDEPIRRVSSIRVNTRAMSLVELEHALKNKMLEKLDRHVPVTLMDKLHARCGLCNAIISLNKKFEIAHLVRHFNSWHPTLHSCSGSWQNRMAKRGNIKPLSINDFAVVDTGSGSPDSLQCIWCGMFVESHCLAQHFGEMHADDIEVPKCNLCMQELILTARLQEKFGLELNILLPDEHHLKCGACGASFSSELNLDNHIQRRHVSGLSVLEDPDGDEEDVNLEEIGPEAFCNSRMTLGKRRRPKRQFIMPALRQAAPLNSEFVEPIAECHWKCKLCEADIYGAVISASAIRHYKDHHTDQADNMQYEICKSRLEKVSDGCMEFIHPQLIECLLCQQSFNLHQPFNICRAIRHLKAKHPNLMPEYAGLSQFDEVEEEDGATNGAGLNRRGKAWESRPTRNDRYPMMYSQQPMLDSALDADMVAGTVSYNMAKAIPDNGVDESDEIVVAEGRPSSLGFDVETSGYSQQFISAEAQLGTPIGGFGGIRVFRTPSQLQRISHHSETVSIAAKNAQLDHGNIVRQVPLDMDRNMMVMYSSHGGDRRRYETTRLTAFRQQELQQQPKRYYLLLTPGTLNVQHDGVDSSAIAMPNEQGEDERQLLPMMDDSMIETQRLAELVSPSNHMLTSMGNDEHQQPQQLMAGDDSLIMN